MENQNKNTEIVLDRNIVINYFFDNFELNYFIDKKQKNKIVNLISLDKKTFYKINLKKIPKPIFRVYKNYNYPVFYHSNEKNDFFLNCFLLLSGIQEKTPDNKDNHCRFKYLNSLQYKYNFTQIPVVSIYFELVFEMIIKENIPIKRKTFNPPIIFTHDIDQLRSGWLEDIKYELKNLKVKSFFSLTQSIFIKIFGLKDSYYKAFEKMMKIEKEEQIQSISFFMTKKSHSDGDYNIEKTKYKYLLNQYKSINKIGLHPGYDTFNNEKEYKKQLNQLEKISKRKISISRQHFLKFDIEKTPDIQNKLNIKEDYSLGFAEMYGFRNSIATPFYLFNFNTNTHHPTLYYPLFFMDATITTYINPKDRKQEIEQILKITSEILTNFNCCFSILFHNTAFSKKRYKGFTEMYCNFIKLSKKNKWE